MVRAVGTLLACCLMASVASAGGSQGVLTADVGIMIPEVFGGELFPAVINPDANYSDKVVPTNTSGLFSGSVSAPLSFDYSGLPVYAIVDDLGNPWNMSADLFATGGGGEDLNAPLFHLTLVGELSLQLGSPASGVYVATGTYHDAINDVLLDVTGTAQFAFPPTGLPNYAWYHMDGSSIDLSGTNVAGVSLASNDDGWASGWPGATLDKNFFGVIPEPSTLLLLSLAGLALVWRGFVRRKCRGVAAR